MRVAFIIQNRNKEKYVARAVKGALSQTHPCLILISDQGSTDHSLAEIQRAVEEFGPRDHKVGIVQCPIRGAYGMRACNQHIQWCVEQLPGNIEWVVQCSSDDYSLPDRVKVCMDAVDVLAAEEKPIVGIVNTMYFEKPEETNRDAVSGFPRESGFIDPAEGLLKLAYGSTIWAYRREWLLKVGLQVDCTLDVYLGFLAALEGLYCVANPQHVHCEIAGGEFQMGFQGKMRGADGEELLRLAELNHFQLLGLYSDTMKRAGELHPNGIPRDAYEACVNTIFGQSHAWLEARRVLHSKNITPGVL